MSKEVKTYESPAPMTSKAGLRLAISDRTDPEGKTSDSHWLLFKGRLSKAIVSDILSYGSLVW